MTEYSRSDTFLSVLAVFFAWTTLYFTLCLLDSKKSYEWHCRIVTFIHATAIVIMSGICSFIQGPWPFTDPAGPNTPLQHWTCVVCLAYFVFDFLWCIYFQTEGMVMFCHHALSILGISLILFRGINGTEMVATIFGTELTNPLLQTRWFLRECGKHDTWYAEVVDLLFMCLFGFLRIGVASVLFYCHWMHPRPDAVARFGAISIYSIGWIFWVMIVKYAIKKYTRKWRKLSTSQKTKLTEQNGVIHSNGELSTKKTD